MSEEMRVDREALAVDALAYLLAKRRSNGAVYMGGEHLPLPSEILDAQRFVRDLLPAPHPQGTETLRALVREHIACCLEDPDGRDVDVETDDLVDALLAAAPAPTAAGDE